MIHIPGANEIYHGIAVAWPSPRNSPARARYPGNQKGGETKTAPPTIISDATIESAVRRDRPPADLPEALVAADVDGAVGDGRGGEDDVAELQGAEHFALFALVADDLENAVFIDCVDVSGGSERWRELLAFHADLPEAVSVGGVAAGEHTAVVNGEDAVAEDEWAGGAGLESADTQTSFTSLEALPGFKAVMPLDGT